MRWQRLVLTTAALFGCGHKDLRPPIAITPPSELCKDPKIGKKDFCLPAARLERILRNEPMTVLQVRPPSSGTNGAKMMYVEFPQEKLVMKAKWKESPPGGDGFNNEPRKELAAYALQKILFEPDDYVVPPTVARCLPRQFYSIEVREQPAAPTFEGTDCTLGVLSYWLENVKGLGPYDEARFARDAAYRDRIATLNLFTYAIDHRDTRKANFLVAKNDADPRAFAIDNGLAFSGFRNPIGYLKRDWSIILVPSMPRRHLERLKQITRADLERLRVVAQFAERDGQLVPVAPTAPIAGQEKVRRAGGIIQLGLTEKEIDDIAERLERLQHLVDEHQVVAQEEVPRGRRHARR